MMKYLAMLIALSIVGSCGPSARERTISTTLAATNAARDAFVTYDDERQAQIVEDATSLEEGKERLADWRAKRERVVAMFEVVYRALAVAATSKKDQDLAEVLALFKQLSDVYEDVVGRKP